MDFSNLIEQRLQVENENSFVSYDDSGESNTSRIVICLPGIGDLRSSYRFLAPLLNTEGFRIVRMDLRGMGGSTANFDDYSAESVGKDIIKLISHLKSASKNPKTLKFVLVSNSMSAAASVFAAAELGRKVITHLVMMGPFVRDPEMSSITTGFLRILMGGFWGVTMWASYYKTLFKTSPPADLNDHIKKITTNMKESGRHSVLIKTLFASKSSCTARINDVNSKVLVVMGSKDPDFDDPKKEVAWIENNFRQGLVESVLINGAGHYPHLEFPQQVAKSIVDFLKP